MGQKCPRFTPTSDQSPQNGRFREAQLIPPMRLRSRSILRRWVLLLSPEPEPEPNPEGKLLFLSSLYLDQTQRAALRDAHI